VTGWQFRPGKRIQRLMCVDTMRRLSAFRPLHDYRYIGLGGYEFVDFDLVYRALGVHGMTSIESKGSFERCEFNRPFAGIDIEWGTTNERLETLALDEPTIIWMDYCGALEKDVLQDVRLLGERLAAGSMLLVTVNATTMPDGERMKFLEDRVTQARVPIDVKSEPDLDGWRTADVQRRILLTEIRDALAARPDGRRFEQLINIRYRDTSRMQTLGGVFVDAGTDSLFRAADFRSLPQVCTASDALTIGVPVLTAREVLMLEEQLTAGAPPPVVPWLKRTEIESFAELHRWYPPVPAPM
jgi:hypothetical protein